MCRYHVKYWCHAWNVIIQLLYNFFLHDTYKVMGVMMRRILSEGFIHKITSKLNYCLKNCLCFCIWYWTISWSVWWRQCEGNAWGVDKQHLDAAPWQCSCSRVTPYPWIFDEAWDDCCPPVALLSRFGPCRHFLVPEVKILSKRSPISDGRGDRRKFDKGPSCHPAKHVPGRVPELEKKTLGAVCQEWRRVLWRRQVWLSCK